MKKELDESIEKFKNSQTSFESYQAISDFVKIIIEVPEFIAYVEKEGKIIRNERIKLRDDRGSDLRGSALEEHNKRRNIKGETLFQLDPVFPLRNLMDVNFGIQPENIVENSIWLFKRFTVGEPLPEADRKEYQGFIDKLYKIILPFLKEEQKENPKEQEEKQVEEKNILKGIDFTPSTGILYIENYQVEISSDLNDKTLGHQILSYIFTSEEELGAAHSFKEISKSDDSLGDYDSVSNFWRKYPRACAYTNEKIREKTGLADLFIFGKGKTGTVKINPKYLE